MYLSLLFIVGRVDRQITAGASKVVFNSGFLKSIVLKCLLKTSFSFGSRGLKLLLLGFSCHLNISGPNVIS